MLSGSCVRDEQEDEGGGRVEGIGEGRGRKTTRRLSTWPAYTFTREYSVSPTYMVLGVVELGC